MTHETTSHGEGATPQRVDLDAIRAPAEVPPEQPDKVAVAEQDAFQRAQEVAALKPTERHMFAIERMLRHLEEENTEFRLHSNALQQQVLDLRERYAELAQARKDVSITAVLSTVAMALGGAVLTVGSAFTTEALKYILMASGFTLLLTGCVFLVVIQLWGWPRVWMAKSERDT